MGGATPASPTAKKKNTQWSETYSGKMLSWSNEPFGKYRRKGVYRGAENDSRFNCNLLGCKPCGTAYLQAFTTSGIYEQKLQRKAVELRLASKTPHYRRTTWWVRAESDLFLSDFYDILKMMLDSKLKLIPFQVPKS